MSQSTPLILQKAVKYSALTPAKLSNLRSTEYSGAEVIHKTKNHICSKKKIYQTVKFLAATAVHTIIGLWPVLKSCSACSLSLCRRSP